MARRVVLMNPGPVLVDESVRQSLLRADICHREPEFSALMDAVRARLVAVCQGDASHAAVVLTGSGTTALEATLSSIVPEHGKVLILDNGHYGERLFAIAAAHRISTSRLAFGWAHPIALERVERTLEADRAITHVALVHHETSTGMLNDVHRVSAVVAAHGRQLVLDAISSVGGEALDIRNDHVDWLVGTANKCIESVPGVSFVCAPIERFEALDDVPPRTFSLDLRTHYAGQQRLGAPPFTPAVQALYALETALELLLREGVAQRAARYQALAHRLRSGMAALGFRFLLAPEHRSNTLTTFYLPAHVPYAELHERLRAADFVIYASQQALRQSTFRVANMGQIRPDEIDRFLEAVEGAVGERCGTTGAR